MLNISKKLQSLVGSDHSSDNHQPISRRNLLQNTGIGAASLVTGGLLAGCGGSNGTAPPAGLSDTDVAILNFALNLEYLEAEFYTYATTGQGIANAGIGTDGTGTPGATTGGAQLTFSDPVLQAVAMEIAEDERDHVALLRNVLGNAAAAKPAINLGALGVGFGNEAEFLAVARALEDTGVSAYAGAANQLENPDIVKAAAQILAAEAYHAGDIRLQVAQNSVATSAVDSMDIVPPPSGTRYYALDNNGLAITRTVAEVLAIVYGAPNVSQGGFFPNGINP